MVTVPLRCNPTLGVGDRLDSDSGKDFNAAQIAARHRERDRGADAARQRAVIR